MMSQTSAWALGDSGEERGDWYGGQCERYWGGVTINGVSTAGETRALLCATKQMEDGLGKPPREVLTHT